MMGVLDDEIGGRTVSGIAIVVLGLAGIGALGHKLCKIFFHVMPTDLMGRDTTAVVFL